jgi:cytochrome c oxidase subunit 2
MTSEHTAQSAERRAPVARRETLCALRSALCAAVLLGACRGATYQSVLEPKGPVAGHVHGLWRFALVVAAAVYAVTIGALLWALWRGARRRRAGLPPDVVDERGMTRGVTLATAATVAILMTFLVYDLLVGRSISGSPIRDPLTIELTGHQWWWEVTYSGPSPRDRFTTANEIHVPVGRPVVFVLNAEDVIHSFWVPNLSGKRDLIPGRATSVWFQADTPGVYRGQCAEFCGLQHAKMALFVVAEPTAQYRQWAEASMAQAPPPSDPAAIRGQQVFMKSSCALCHNIEGTLAGSRAGPDLTHLASRRTIAAGTLRNTRGNLAGWIVDPQRIKPGANMPPNALAPDDLEALLTYLQSLR